MKVFEKSKVLFNLSLFGSNKDILLLLLTKFETELVPFLLASPAAFLALPIYNN